MFSVSMVIFSQYLIFVAAALVVLIALHIHVLKVSKSTTIQLGLGIKRQRVYLNTFKTLFKPSIITKPSVAQVLRERGNVNNLNNDTKS